jgi:polar amino acid transport system substrate-binding protein
MKINALKCGLLAVVAATCCAPSVARADALDDIKARGKMIVAIDPTFAPYEYTTSDGAITGYDPSLLALIAKDLGVTVEYQRLAFDGVIPGLVAGSFDFTCTALNVTAERAKRIAYTVPVSKSQDVVLARQDGTVKGSSPEDLSGHTVAVKATTQPERLLRQIDEDLESAGKQPIQILSLPTIEQTMEALTGGRADAVVDDVSVIGAQMGQSKVALRIAGNIGEPVYIAWGTRKSDPKLTQALDEELKKLEADGRMQASQKQFLSVSFDLPTSDFLPK